VRLCARPLPVLRFGPERLPALFPFFRTIEADPTSAHAIGYMLRARAYQSQRRRSRVLAMRRVISQLHLRQHLALRRKRSSITLVDEEFNYRQGSAVRRRQKSWRGRRNGDSMWTSDPKVLYNLRATGRMRHRAALMDRGCLSINGCRMMLISRLAPIKEDGSLSTG
jgi:hypothetical protein